MWIHISKIAKTIIFSTQTDVETFHKLFFCKAIHNYCRKHQKFTKFIILHNRTQIGEKFSPIVKKKKKLAFSQVPQQLFFKQVQIAHTQKFSKTAINCSYIYYEEDYGKYYKHTPFSFKCTVVSTGVTNAQITKTNKTCIYCKLQHRQI